MTDFWRLVFPARIWSLATLCDTLITFGENHWLLRLIWRFSESVSEYESVFRICVWIIIHHIYSSNKFIKSIIIDRSIVLHFPSCVGFYKINMFQLSSLWNRIVSGGWVIIGSVGRSVCGRWVGGTKSGWSVVGWSVGRLSVDLIKPISCSLAKVACYLTSGSFLLFTHSYCWPEHVISWAVRESHWSNLYSNI